MSLSPQIAPAAPGFDGDRLDAFLRERVSGLSGRLRLTRIAGGQSNPTFFVDYDASLAGAPQAASGRTVALGTRHRSRVPRDGRARRYRRAGTAHGSFPRRTRHRRHAFLPDGARRGACIRRLRVAWLHASGAQRDVRRDGRHDWRSSIACDPERSDWPTSASPATISRVRLHAGRVNGRTAARATIRRSPPDRMAACATCRPAKTPRSATAISAWGT